MTDGRLPPRRHGRAAVIAAAASLLRAGLPLTMRAVAAAAGVSRSTLYRHFPGPDELRRALREEALARAEAAVAPGPAVEQRPVLAELRGVVEALAAIGAELPVDAAPDTTAADEALARVAAALLPLADRVAHAAGLDPPLPDAWALRALAHFVEAGLRAGWEAGERAAADRLLLTVTDPLDRGLLLLDADGTVVAANPEGDAVARDGALYEDGSPAPAAADPVAAAVRTGEPHRAVRGRHAGDGGVVWHSIDVHPLRRRPDAAPYGFVAIAADVTDERRFAQEKLRPAGALAGTQVPVLDVVRALDEIPPALLPEQLVAEATRIVRGPVALYVVDIDGSRLLRLAGNEEFPARLAAPLALGPELATDGLPDLSAHLARELPGVVMAPMWLRGRAVGVLLARRGSAAGLREMGRLGAAAMELAGGYTDVFDAARRRKGITPAAEIQQSLLPPRIVRLGSGELAGSVLPSYEVGGDWFDYVENPNGTWIAIADGAGRGPRAAGLSSVALAALRAARRSGATLEEAAALMDETVATAGGPAFFATAVLARWHPVHAVFSWINLGHPPPLLVRADGTAEELASPPDLPLGLTDRPRGFHRRQRRLEDGDRLVLYTDGISRRRTGDGAFGVEGIVAAVRAAGPSAPAAARAVQEAVVSASEDPLPDDAAIVVLAVGDGG
jgi:AcrR family transcriptional regulator